MFLKQEIKNKIDSLWDKFWSGGIANPLNAIEQITALLFLKMLSEKDDENMQMAMFGGEYKSIFEKYEDAKWSNFKHLAGENMLIAIRDKAFPFLKIYEENSQFSKAMRDLPFIITKPSLLSDAVKLIDDIWELVKDDNNGYLDGLGDIYEYLLSEISSSGKNGQFRTPRHIIKMIVDLVEPKIGERVFDPSCGTAGFLVGAYNKILEPYSETGKKLGSKLTDEESWKTLKSDTFFGNDTDLSMIRISMMNMMLHNISNPNIEQKDTLSKSYNVEDYFQVVLANPPFKGSIDKDEKNENFSISSTKTELLFLDLIVRVLDVGGRAGVILPDGVLFGSSNAHKTLRKKLLEDNELKAVISMPSGVFKPYAGVSTAVLIFVKGGKTDKVWFYDMENDGFSLDDKRNPIDKSDIPDILEKFKSIEDENYKSSKKDFFVDISKIQENDYDLSINRYKEIDYEEVIYSPTEEILSEIDNLSKSIEQDLNELKSLLNSN